MATRRSVPDVRGASGALGAVVRALDRFHRRHPWSHNDHYHRWIVRRLPVGATRALDVGCGRGGLLAELVRHVPVVDGVDVDAEMVRAASARFAGDDRVTVRQLRFDEVEGAPDTGYDVITMVAALHHMGLEPSLRRAAGLLRAGGRLLVVGIAPASDGRDLAVDLLPAVLNPFVGLAKHPRRARPGERAGGFPVAEPTATLAEIRTVSARVLPGARVRRRLWFRHTLEWTKPATLS
ncbi:class I SAM-dependent methyltransferase [Jatrophihabitans fulvus]